MTNELANQTQTQLMEASNLPQVALKISEDEQFVTFRKPDGTFMRKAKFKEYTSIVAETKADKIWLFNVLNSDEDTGNGLKSKVGQHIEVANVITQTYTKLDEKTGDIDYGVLTYLFTKEKDVFVTSSKTVFFKLFRLMDTFGYPHEDGFEPFTIKITSTKGQNGNIIGLELVG